MITAARITIPLMPIMINNMNKLKKTKIPMLSKWTTFLVVALFILPGCGGGGSRSVNVTPLTGTSFLDEASSANAAVAIARVAEAIPRAGSVTQSSNTINGITTDQVEVTAQHGATGNNYSVQNGSKWSISTADGNPVSISVPNFDGQELHKRVNGGTLYVNIYSDIEPGTVSTPDTDYLAGGVGLFVPDDETSVDDFVFVAFGDGNDPFRQDNLVALQGAARYNGEATGIYSGKSDGATEIDYFGANVTLTANFGGSDALGTIAGSLTDFEVEGESVLGSLTLGTADIGSSNSGFFQGQVSGASEGTSYTGRWGGQFSGNGEADGKPGSVFGTFGGRSENNDGSFVGVFGAYKQ